MPDRDEKIFPALPEKRKRSREEGNVARSRELTGSLSFLLAVVVIAGATAMLGRFLVEVFNQALLASRSASLGDAVYQSMARPMAAVTLLTTMLAIGAVVGATAQDGFVLTLGKLAPDLSKLNPIPYFGRVFSAAGLVELGKAAIKIVVVAIVGWDTARWTLAMGGAGSGVGRWLLLLKAGTLHLLYWSAALALVVGGADYAYKRYEYESDLKMTRQEFLDELKQQEGNPHVKQAVRRAQRRNFKRVRGIHQAAAASVVLTNPTHYAVALRYRRGFDKAPLVVAKGAGENALRIIAIARLAAVPVIERKPIARALFRATEVGDYIPRQFYRAIAEVLAAIMRADRSRRENALRGA